MSKFDFYISEFLDVLNDLDYFVENILDEAVNIIKKTVFSGFFGLPFLIWFIFSGRKLRPIEGTQTETVLTDKDNERLQKENE